MAFQLPAAPDFDVKVPQQPDYLQQYGRMLELRNLQQQQQLYPLQLQAERQKVEQAAALAPSQLEEAKNRASLTGTQAQSAQVELQSQKAMMDAVANGALNKYAGTDTAQSDGTGFDAAGAYNDLVTKYKVLPAHASQLVNSFQTVAKNSSEIRKNLDEANEKALKVRADSHEQMAEDIAAVTKLPQDQQQVAWQNLQREYRKNPPPGIDRTDLALFDQSDVAHASALAGMLHLNSRIEDFHNEQAKKAGEAAKGEQTIRAAAPPTGDQLTNAVTTLNTYAAIPSNLRAGLAKEMKAAPDNEMLQKIQARADAANESFQRSADARAQAMALKDVATKNLVAGKLVGEDEKLGTALDQTGGIRSLLNMSKGGNEAATNAALTRFAEHEIVEGGVKRMNQVEYENLATKLGSWGRKFTAWADSGFKGEMPAATNAEIQTILDAEEAAAHATHERNTGYIMDRYGSSPSQKPSGSRPTTPAAPPPGATMKVPGSDGKLHWSDGKRDLGVSD